MDLITGILGSLAGEVAKQPLIQGALISIIVSQVQKALVAADKIPVDDNTNKIVGQIVVGLSVLVAVGQAFLNHTLEALPLQNAANALQVWIGAMAAHQAGTTVKGK